MHIPTSLIDQLSERLGLSYQPVQPKVGNVCMADSKDVRPEYRTSFTPTDIMRYVKAKLGASPDAMQEKNIDFTQVPLPTDVQEFFMLDVP